MQKEWWRLWEAPWLAQETSESFLFLVTGQLIATLLESLTRFSCDPRDGGSHGLK